MWELFKDQYEWSVPLTGSGQVKPIPDKMKPLPTDSEFFSVPGKISATESSVLSSIQPISAQQAQAVLKLERQSITPIAEPDFSREWYIDDKVERWVLSLTSNSPTFAYPGISLALNGAFTIFYFVKDNDQPIPKESNYMLEPSLAGITHVFAAPQDLCDHCGRQDQQGTVVSNTVAITSLLLDYVTNGQLESLQPEHVKPFLVRGLMWRVVSASPNIPFPHSLPSKKIHAD